MKIFAFGGLGVDKKVFTNLNLKDELIIVEWIATAKNEGLKSYLKRISKNISTDSPFALLGVSFGGMVVVELSKMLNPDLTIIISSAAHYKELPFIYRLFGKTNLLSLIPHSLLRPPVFLMHYLFGVANKDEKALLKQIIQETDTRFLKWALGIIINWNNTQIPRRIYRIHGNKDRIIPCPKNTESEIMKGEGHFMIVTQADTISDFINKKMTNNL